MSALTAYKGDDRIIPLTFTEDAVALDITGYTIFFTIKKKMDFRDDDTEALLTKDVTVHTDAVNGLSQIELVPADLSFDTGEYKYDIQLKDASGAITTVLVSTFTLVDDVSKRTA